MNVAVTGAAGAVGSLVVRRLVNDPGVDVNALVRDPARRPNGPRIRPALVDYNDPASLDRALHGVDALIFIGSDGEADRMLSHHHNILVAARRAGVGCS